MKEAMKAKENFKRDVIRFTLSAIKQVEIDNRVELDDEEVIKIIQKLLKQRMDAKEQFQSAGRIDLVEKEEAEAEILKLYLPEQLSEEKIRQIVQGVIEKTGANSMKDMGKVMGMSIKECGANADGSMINAIVKQMLS